MMCGEFRPDDGPAIAFDTAFQPIFDMRSGQVFAYEALARGPNGESAASVLGSVRPEHQFAFEDRVRVYAIAKAAALGLVDSPAALAVNITPSTVGHPGQSLEATIAAAAAARLPHERIIFEFTEDVRIDLQSAARLAATYCRQGFRCAIDDFGAAYHSLLLLADLHTEIVKLDMGLIRGIDRSPVRRRIVAATAALLRELGREIVAEGIETAAELAVVRKLGITLVQGFHLGMPSRLELQRQPQGLDHAA